jgi:hypothetical protein
LSKLHAKNVVYVVEDDGSKNFTPAFQYGSIVVLENKDMPTHGRTEHIINRIAENLKNFDPKEDYLLMTGDPVLNGTIASILLIKFREIRMLKWDRQNLSYFPITITIPKNIKQEVM